MDRITTKIGNFSQSCSQALTKNTAGITAAAQQRILRNIGSSGIIPERGCPRYGKSVLFHNLGFVLSGFLLLGKILRQVQAGQVEQVRHRGNGLHQAADEIGGRSLSVGVVA